MNGEQDEYLTILICSFGVGEAANDGSRISAGHIEESRAYGIDEDRWRPRPVLGPFFVLVGNDTSLSILSLCGGPISV
jgi:hypothetical protein